MCIVTMVTLVTGNSNVDENEHLMRIKQVFKVIVRTSMALLSTHIGKYPNVSTCTQSEKKWHRCIPS